MRSTRPRPDPRRSPDLRDSRRSIHPRLPLRAGASVRGYGPRQSGPAWGAARPRHRSLHGHRRIRSHQGGGPGGWSAAL